jgi:hypothetical protein
LHGEATCALSKKHARIWHNHDNGKV